MKPLKTPASFVVIALLICACTVLFGQSEEQSTEPSKLTIVNVQSYLCDRLDNSANEQDPAVWPHDVLLRKQASTGVRKYIVRHPQPKQPKGFVYHYNSMMLTRRIDDAMARNIYLAARRCDELSVYLGSPVPTEAGVPGDPQIVDLAMQQFGKAEPDWTAFDKHVRRIHEPLIDSNIYAVIYDAQSRALIERKPYLRFYEQASKLLNQRHVRLGVESPAHPDKRFDPLRKLTTVSGSVYSVWLTNRDNAQTYPAHHVPFVFIETNANSEDTSGGGPVTDADVIRERAIEVAAWANEQDRDVRIVADWFYWLGQSGFKTLDEWFTESLQ